MGDFGDDTAIRSDSGRYTAKLSRDWEIWGPNGGYVAAIALRAMGAASRFRRPANCAVHFLGVASFDEVQLDVEVVKATRRAESIRVMVHQGDRPILQLIGWAVDDGLPGLEHTYGLPDIGSPDEVPTVEERLAAKGEVDKPPFAFWDNLQQRPVVWVDDWENRPVMDPVWPAWLRFRPRPTFDDPWLDAGRVLLLADLGGWPAAHRAHPGDDWIAPSLDVAVQFNALRPESEWLYVDHVSATAGDGLIGDRSQVYAEDGTLLATSITQLLCTPTRR